MKKSILDKKYLSVALALVLLLAIAIPYLPSALGVTFNSDARLSYAYCAASPNPAYFGTTVFFVGWVYPAPSQSGALYGDFTFTLTKPDGTRITQTAPSNTQASAAFGYVVDQLGNWTLQFTFQGDTVALNRLPSAPSNIWTEQVINGTFTQPAYNALPTYPWISPVSSTNLEWFRISGNWLKQQPNGGSNYNMYSDGPTTAHILWTKAYKDEGLIGGSLGHLSVPRDFVSGSTLPSDPVAWNNRMYYSYQGTYDNNLNQNNGDLSTGTLGAGSTGGPGAGGIPVTTTNTTLLGPTTECTHIRCVDMNTGATLWDTIVPFINYSTATISTAAMTGARTLFIVQTTLPKGGTVAQDYGVTPPGGNDLGSVALWVTGGGMWHFDPITGGVEWYELTPALSPTYDPWTNNWFIGNYPQTGLYSAIDASEDQNNGWPPASLYPTTAIVGGQNVTTYAGCLVWSDNMTTTGISANYIGEGYIVQLQTNSTTQGRKLNTWSASTGKLVANGTYYAAPNDEGSFASSGSNPCYGDGHYTLLCADGVTRAWSFATGNFDWASPQMDLPWGVFGDYQGFCAPPTVGGGTIVSASYAPYKYFYNATTGALEFKVPTGVIPTNPNDPNGIMTGNSTLNPFNYLFAENGPPSWGCVASGTNAMYYPTGEHTPANPNQQGKYLYAVKYDGTILWMLPGVSGEREMSYMGIADGKLWFHNQYDGKFYMMGTGPSQMTVSISQNPVAVGSSTMIQGRVTDISQGALDMVSYGRFPNGVPAVSDESQSTWNAYLYTYGTTGVGADLSTVTGVPVTLTAIGSDGSVTNIGTVTANSNGNFASMWSPPKANVIYTIIATFAGSGAYYPSYAETLVGATAAPASPIVTPTVAPTASPTASPIVTPTVAPTPTPTTPSGPGGIPASTVYAIAAAVVIIVIIVVAAVALRRRK